MLKCFVGHIISCCDLPKYYIHMYESWINILIWPKKKNLYENIQYL